METRVLSNKPIIPKEQLTAYQRWEMAAIDDDDSPGMHSADPALPDPIGAVSSLTEPLASESAGVAEGGLDDDSPSSLPYPTAEEMEAIHQQAYQDAFGEGQKAGYEQGFEQGLGEGRQLAQQELLRLTGLLDELVQSRIDFESQMADSILDLALALAQQMLRQALPVRRDLLVPLIREAMAAMPQAAQHPRILVNPEDGRLLRELMATDMAHAGIRFVDDASVTEGGCLIECGSSDIDASVESRWQRVLQSLGRSGDWLTGGHD